MTTKKVIVTLMLAVAGFVLSCSKKGGGPGDSQQIPLPNSCDGVSAQFASDISPIIQTRCATGAGCHGSGSSNGPGALTNFTQIKNAAITIRAAVVSGEMPLGSTLSGTQVAEISCWVDHGALNN